jgi:hypothetical protein
MRFSRGQPQPWPPELLRRRTRQRWSNRYQSDAAIPASRWPRCLLEARVSHGDRRCPVRSGELDPVHLRGDDTLPGSPWRSPAWRLDLMHRVTDNPFPGPPCIGHIFRASALACDTPPYQANRCQRDGSERSRTGQCVRARSSSVHRLWRRPLQDLRQCGARQPPDADGEGRSLRRLRRTRPLVPVRPPRRRCPARARGAEGMPEDSQRSAFGERTLGGLGYR